MGIFDIDKSQVRIQQLDELTGAADFWNDQQKAQTLLKEKYKKFPLAKSSWATSWSLKKGKP